MDVYGTDSSADQVIPSADVQVYPLAGISAIAIKPPSERAFTAFTVGGERNRLRGVHDCPFSDDTIPPVPEATSVPFILAATDVQVVNPVAWLPFQVLPSRLQNEFPLEVTATRRCLTEVADASWKSVPVYSRYTNKSDTPEYANVLA